MKNIFTKLGFKKQTSSGSNPAYEFFVNASSREKKRVYNKALKAAQEDQLRILNKGKA